MGPLIAVILVSGFYVTLSACMSLPINENDLIFDLVPSSPKKVFHDGEFFYQKKAFSDLNENDIAIETPSETPLLEETDPPVEFPKDGTGDVGDFLESLRIRFTAPEPNAYEIVEAIVYPSEEVLRGLPSILFREDVASMGSRSTTEVPLTDDDSTGSSVSTKTTSVENSTVSTGSSRPSSTSKSEESIDYILPEDEFGMGTSLDGELDGSGREKHLASLMDSFRPWDF